MPTPLIITQTLLLHDLKCKIQAISGRVLRASAASVIHQLAAGSL
jgi:hypothetical protein